MSTRISLEYCGMHGTGKTVTEAKKDAARKIEAALDGSYTPHVIAWRGYARLLYRHPCLGWVSTFIVDPDRTLGSDPSTSTSQHGDDLKTALNDVRRHVAQCGMNVDEDDETTTPEILANYPEALADWHRDLAWQKRFRVATAAGLDHNDAHAWAGGWIHRPDLANAVPA